MCAELAQAPLQAQDWVQPVPAQVKGFNTSTCIRVSRARPARWEGHKNPGTDLYEHSKLF